MDRIEVYLVCAGRNPSAYALRSFIQGTWKEHWGVSKVEDVSTMAAIALERLLSEAANTNPARIEIISNYATTISSRTQIARIDRAKKQQGRSVKSKDSGEHWDRVAILIGIHDVSFGSEEIVLQNPNKGTYIRA